MRPLFFDGVSCHDFWLVGVDSVGRIIAFGWKMKKMVIF